MSNQNAYVSAEDLTKIYPSMSKPAVERVSMELEPGKILAFLGPNGAGKTTTIKMIAGLIAPSSGRVRVMGYDVQRQRLKANRHIGAVLEGARNLYWRLPAWENLFYFGTLRSVPPRQISERSHILLEMMDLHERKDQEVRHFSRGMQQKLAIITALLHEPEVLLLDEPTLGLDVQSAKKIEDFVLQLSRQQNKSILLTTHTMDLAERLADRIFVIHQGRQVAYDSTENLLSQYQLEQQVIEIRTAGSLEKSILTKVQQGFTGIEIELTSDRTVFRWSTPAQTDVISFLERIDQAGVTILDVTRRHATLEEVFLSLTRTEKV